jgi:hypothetical protein
VKSIALIGAEWFAGQATLPPRNGDPKELSTVVTAATVSPQKGLQNTLAALQSSASVTYDNGKDIDKAVKAAQQADIAIVMVGDTPRETRDKTTLALPKVNGTDQEKLVPSVLAANANTVVVLKTEGMVLMPWLSQARALVEAWYPGQEDGNAVADMLFGVTNPSGKLPVTFGHSEREAAYATEAQYPGVREDNGLGGGKGGFRPDGEPQLVTLYSENLEMGYRWYQAENVAPLFAFGHGLSYTTFAYSDLTVTPSNSAAGKSMLTVEYTITNSGARAGKEASQVYVTLPAEANEPSKRLVGFQKVNLRPGETRRVAITIDESAPNHPLSYFEPDTSGTWADGGWLTPSGTYTVHVGTSSADTPLQTTVDLSFPEVRSSLRVETPNAPSQWGVGTRQRIAWTYAGTAATFQIEISRDGGTAWDPVAIVYNRPGNSQNFLWTVQGPATSAARLRVVAFGERSASDMNDADIQIAPANIEILRLASPVASGSATTIFYTHNLGAGARVAIDVSVDDGVTWAPLAETMTRGSTGSSFRWTVDLPPTPSARVRARALDGSGAEAVSAPFAVTAAAPASSARVGAEGTDKSLSAAD